MILNSRRAALRTIAGAGIVAAGGWMGRAAVYAQTPQPMASPNAPSNPNVPAGMNGPDYVKPEATPRAPMIQMQISNSVQQLCKLAAELKDEVEHTNLNTTFSLGFVKKAQQIEKLAKQIKNEARG